MFNVTLIIQGINFLIAYFILSKFLFKPVLNDIKRDNDEIDLLNNLIKNYRIHLNDSLIKKDQIWKRLNTKIKSITKFCKNIDSQNHASDSGISSLNLTINDSDKSIKQATDILVDKIISSE